MRPALGRGTQSASITRAPQGLGASLFAAGPPTIYPPAKVKPQATRSTLLQQSRSLQRVAPPTAPPGLEAHSPEVRTPRFYTGAAMTASPPPPRAARIARFYGSFRGQKAYVPGSRRGLLGKRKAYRRERLVSLGSGIGGDRGAHKAFQGNV